MDRFGKHAGRAATRSAKIHRKPLFSIRYFGALR